MTSEWRWAEDGQRVLRSPMVANLTDDDGDGEVTAADIPDVVGIAGSTAPHSSSITGPLLLLDGATGAVHRAGIEELDGDMGIAIADVTGDGVQEIVFRRAPGGIPEGTVALDAAFDEVWEGEWSGNASTSPTVADLDNDGHAEVIDDASILDGRDGTTRATFASTLNLPIFDHTVITADLDLDGSREVIVGNVVLAADGTLLWTGLDYAFWAWPVVANVDSDPEGEVLLMSHVDPPGLITPPFDVLDIRDTDGTAIAALPLDHKGALAMADLDGDGAPELVVSGDLQTTALALDGTVRWTVAHATTAGPASAFDFDGDGAYEVVVGDATGFDILDGRTGASHVRVSSSVARDAFPVIADLDNDGSAEILVVGDAIGAWGNPSCSWPKGGAGWGIHDFNGANLGDDGAVPTDDPPIWQGSGNFRARP